MEQEYKEYYTLQDVAKKFCVCDRTVRNMIKDGYLDYVMIGKSMRITQKNIDDMIKKSNKKNIK